ncbi:class I adenylate-forming enzyme family protein [Rhizorhapis suberifaciens]|uniref:Acyl-coenzyme A synthetase/AMP-(Fatty) acid ligase n=1 Tax=Rhizorhapis suberifaciens TaxID=13656 RepID=A0A840HTA6_9SPHN|nr:class I adenylate-forming enzyme family protein [Rhizorhapis suberifaciens]MBB4640734.1 acyl-coenzyme A synthetase/AMP-(fatty) acid ligase [Rhizorhapis suberifaciens]
MLKLNSLRERCLDAVLSDETAGAGNFVYKLNAAIAPEEQETAVVLLGETSTEDEPLTLCDIVARTDLLASAYLAEGVEARDVVSVYLGDDFDYFLHFVALNSIGAIPNPINGVLGPEILVEFVTIVRSKFLIVDKVRAAMMADLFAGLPTTVIPIDRIKNRRDFPPRPEPFRHQPDDIMMIGHTSGTTGLPKPAIFTHESMFHGVREQIVRQKGEHVLSALPHSHGAAMTLLMLSLSRGARVSIASRKEPAALLNAIDRVGPDLVIAFPKVFVDLCRMDLSQWDLGSVMHWIATGDANHESHIKALIAKGHHIKDGIRYPGSRFVDNLGSSEIAFAAFRNVHSSETNRYDRCIGKPFPWIRPAVFDDNGKRVRIGEVGRLGIISKSLTKGYWNNHSLSEKNKIDGYWLTGDLVYFNENGLFYFVDRTSDVIHTEGGTLYSCQVEEWLMKRLPEVFEISIVGRLDASGSNKIIALIELRENVVSLSSTELLHRINDLMAERGFIAIDAIEMQSAHLNVGATGKKLKRTLRIASQSLSA